MAFVCKQLTFLSKTSASKVFINNTPRRWLWGYLNSVFNRVDKDRVKEVGCDRACAEWVLRCGGSVRWAGLKHWEKDYNSLPGSGFEKYHIEVIDGSGSAIMGMGFPHLQGLKYVKKIILHDCKYLNDEAIVYLPLVKNTLEHLQISSCGDVTTHGLKPVSELKNLQTLIIFDLPEIRNKQKVLDALQSALPNCNIDFTDVE